MKNNCPACGNGKHGVDPLCDVHYFDYLGQNLGARSDDPLSCQVHYTDPDSSEYEEIRKMLAYGESIKS